MVSQEKDNMEYIYCQLQGDQKKRIDKIIYKIYEIIEDAQ